MAAAEPRRRCHKLLVPKGRFYPLCHHLLLKEKPTEQLIPISAKVCWGAFLPLSPAVEHLWTQLRRQDAGYMGGQVGSWVQEMRLMMDHHIAVPCGQVAVPTQVWQRTGEGERGFVAWDQVSPGDGGKG